MTTKSDDLENGEWRNVRMWYETKIETTSVKVKRVEENDLNWSVE
jgi:hypothetical protein